MPTLLFLNGFRFFFFSNEHDPAHVHVEKGDAVTKFNLIPVTLVKNEGMKPKELKQAEEMVRANQEFFLKKWNQHFGR
jgi:hypothetical protein